ncbi:omega-hydroxypalmitate O-feruloyl transferase-like [Salvia hispanica]|uniref:omega-hydroxypalmitate O-feruloyl transferase-like n=1 Tax=Salvia hispanica TaxID=49212 RepID=UPI002008F378|nr:omega-hydroxypalmitate O-feruloyl transferase-like [Salvia hispanica]
MSNNIISLIDEDVVKQEAISVFSPNNPTPTETIFLSNIDQAVTFPVETVFFYEAPPCSSTAGVAEMVRKAVENVLLIPYYFMAGRLSFNDESKRLELICNNTGVLFVSAESRFSLEDLGNLSHPNPTFHRFVHRPGLYKSLPETAIFTVQVTKFACGGFALGFVTNHAILDGKSASQMFQDLGSICRGDAEEIKKKSINNERSCIKSRTPPQIDFPHKEYIQLGKTSSLASSFTSQARNSPSPLIFSDKYTHRVLRFTSEMLKLLKDKAEIKCSTFEAIVAHIWRARTMAYFNDEDRDRESMVLFAVDVRERVSPPLPGSFAGNAVITAFASARVGDLVGRPAWFGVEMVRRGRERVTPEYIRSVIDWLEVYKGIPATGGGGFYVSAWWKLPFGEVDIGFGRPKHAGPIVSGNDEFVVLLGQGQDGQGINVWIGLDKDKMDTFLSCVYQI